MIRLKEASQPGEFVVFAANSSTFNGISVHIGKVLVMLAAVLLVGIGPWHEFQAVVYRRKTKVTAGSC